jgi:hypothetical protein
MSDTSDDNKKPCKILFVVSSTAQAELFSNVRTNLSDWEVKAINVDKINHPGEMENILSGLNFPFKTIPGVSSTHVDAILREEKPGIVVFGHDRNELDRLFIKSANLKGIPTLLVQDGIMAASRDQILETGKLSVNLKYWFSSPIRALIYFLKDHHSWKNKIETAIFELKYGNRGKLGVYGHGECLKMAVFGDSVKRMLISEGIDSDRIVVTGSPKFDAVLKSRSGRSKEKVCQRFGIPLDKKIILLFTEYFVESGLWSPEERIEFILTIANAVAKLPDTQLIIKLHPPYEKEEDYQEIVKGLKPEPIICKYTDLPELINSCSLAAAVSSTALLEAMFVEKPVLVINFNDSSGVDFYKNSGALIANTLNEILPMMQKALYDPEAIDDISKNMSKFIYQQAYLQDGQSSKRIVDLIGNMAANKKSNCNAENEEDDRKNNGS